MPESRYVEFDVDLVVDEDRVRRTSLPGRAKLGIGEIAIALKLVIPRKLFQRPILQASVKIPEDAVPTAGVTEELRQEVREAVTSVTEGRVLITVVEEK